jgi:hypothetical protein
MMNPSSLCRDDMLRALGQLLKDVQVGKRMIGWELEALEARVREIQRSADM